MSLLENKTAKLKIKFDGEHDCAAMTPRNMNLSGLHWPNSCALSVYIKWMASGHS